MKYLAAVKPGELRGTPDRTILSQDHGQCTKCHATKPLSEFGGWPRNKWCKPCCKVYQQKLRRDGYKPSGRNKHLAAMDPEERAIRRRCKKMMHGINQRSRRYGDVIAITQDDIRTLWEEQGGKCALSGLPLRTEEGDLFVASPDKIDPTRGYTLDNVQLTCWAANRAKGELSTSAFLELCRAVVRRNDYPDRE